MEIFIEDKAKKFIRKKSKENAVKVDMFEANTCWVPISEPSVEVGKPKVVEEYEIYDIDDIRVYYKKEFAIISKEMKIVLDSYFGLKYLKIDGYKLI